MYVCVKLHVHIYMYMHSTHIVDIQHPIQKCVHHWIYGVISQTFLVLNIRELLKFWISAGRLHTNCARDRKLKDLNL